MLSNSIVRFELIRAARQPRHYAMRAAAGLVLLYVAWMLYRAFDEPWLATAGASERSWLLRHLRWIADLLVLELVWTQGVAIVLLVPGLVAGSIAEEDRRGTMRDLLGTPLSGGSIVLGKLAVRLVQVGAAMAIGLPVVVPLALFGALDLAVVARAYAMLIALAAFIGSLAMLVAVVVRRPRAAILWAYLVVVGWLLLPAWSAALAGRPGWPFPWLLAVVEAIRQSHPLEAARNLWLVAFFGLRDPTNLGWAWAGLSRALPRAVGLQLAGSAIFLLLASLLLRPRRLEAWGHQGRETIARSRPAVDEDDPMLWKETRAHARLPRRMVRVAVILLVAFVAWPLLGPAADAFREWRASWWDGRAADWRRYDLNEALRNLGAGLYLLGLLAATAMAATSVTGERERATWTSLAMTLVDGRQVVRAKVAGALWAVRGLLVPFAVIWGIGLATGSVHPIGVLASAAGLVTLLGYGAALGVLSLDDLAELGAGDRGRLRGPPRRQRPGAGLRAPGPHRPGRRVVVGPLPGRRVAVRRVAGAGLAHGRPLVPEPSDLGHGSGDVARPVEDAGPARLRPDPGLPGRPGPPCPGRGRRDAGGRLGLPRPASRGR